MKQTFFSHEALKALHWITRLLLGALCLFWAAYVGILAFSYHDGGMEAVRTKVVHVQGPEPHPDASLGSGGVAILQIHHAYQTIIKLLLLTWAVSWLNGKVSTRSTLESHSETRETRTEPGDRNV